MAIKFSVPMLLVLLLCACSGPQLKLESVDRDIADSIEIYKEKSKIKESNVKIIGVVEATSCKHLMWEKEPSVENCVDQLRMKVYELGGTALVFAESEYAEADFSADKGINRNCWATIDCSGIAIIE